MSLPWLQLELAWPWGLLGLLALPMVIWASRCSLAPLARRQRRVVVACRVAIVLLLVLAACGATWLRTVRQQFVVFVHDTTDSVDTDAQARAEKLIAEANAQRGSDVSTTVKFSDAQQTDLAEQIQRAAARVPNDYAGHVVLLSDGRQTQGDALAAAAGAGMRVSTVPLDSYTAPEVRVAELLGPRQAYPFEVVTLEAVVESNQAGSGRLELTSAGTRVAQKNVSLRPGRTEFTFRAAVGDVGTNVFSATLHDLALPNDEADTRAGNNRASVAVQVVSAPSVLIVRHSGLADSALVRLLEQLKFDVSTIEPMMLPDRAVSLEGTALVILDNTPPASMSRPQAEALTQYARDGGGLLAVGGREAFGEGLADSPLQQVLPVSRFQERAEDRAKVALVLAMDRSRSMEQENRIALAKEAARQSVEVLSSRDEVGVVVFGSQAEWISELGPLEDKQQVLQRIDALTTEGATNMFPALDRAYVALRPSDARVKHVIVLTDGLSAPGDFERIAREMAAAGITVSTVAVGKEAERVLLEDIALAAGGRSYHCANPQDVPEILVRETKAAATSLVREEPFLPVVVTPTPSLVPADFSSAPPLAGYVRTAPKAVAELVLRTEEADPLLAWWRYGRGIVAVFTSAASGAWAGEWHDWPGFAPFWTSLVRHTARRPNAPPYQLDVARRADELVVRLDLVDERGRPVNKWNPWATIRLPGGSRQKVSLTAAAPGLYVGSMVAPLQGIYQVHVAAPAANGMPAVDATRSFSFDYPLELRSGPPNEPLLRAIAEISGGTHDIAADEVFARGGRVAQRPTALWRLLLALAAVLWVADVALRRIPLPWLQRRPKGGNLATTSNELELEATLP